METGVELQDIDFYVCLFTSVSLEALRIIVINKMETANTDVGMEFYLNRVVNCDLSGVSKTPKDCRLVSSIVEFSVYAQSPMPFQFNALRTLPSPVSTSVMVTLGIRTSGLCVHILKVSMLVMVCVHV